MVAARRVCTAEEVCRGAKAVTAVEDANKRRLEVQWNFMVSVRGFSEACLGPVDATRKAHKGEIPYRTMLEL